MNHTTCTSCHQPIPAGLAVLRSVNFVQVAWHRECYAAIPAQRTGAEQAVSVR